MYLGNIFKDLILQTVVPVLIHKSRSVLFTLR